MSKQKTVIVCSAHSDDFVIGAGGTIAKYTNEGYKVVAIVFSYGESSHPWLKEEIVQKMRSDETFEASKLLKCKVHFFDLREFKFMDDCKEKGIDKKIQTIFESVKPAKVFTHSNEDPHPDHQAVYKITKSLIDKVSFKPEVYIYSVWNPVSFKTAFPALYVDISKTFKTKLDALKTFRSQKFHIIYPFFLLIYRAFIEGFHIKVRYAEKFFRIQ